MNAPSGNITFLFTDIEGSTMLAQKNSVNLQTILEKHNSILNNTISENNGYIFKTAGDAFCASFMNTGDALNCAVEIQGRILKEDWGEQKLSVRMGLHAGEAQFTDNDYSGYITLVRAQRIMSAANGGQILITDSVFGGMKNYPDKFIFRDMGERKLKGLVKTEHVYQVSTANLTLDFPPINTHDVRPNNLPVQVTSFIGREKEMADVWKLLSNARLVTLLGTGGTGKTRLLIKTGVDIIDDFAYGVWFVDLASISDPAFVEKEIAAVLKLVSDGSMKTMELIIDFLKNKDLLLLLDNCEHLIEVCAKISDSLLSHCPKLKILTSSREALNITGEMIYQIPSLSLPPPDIKATPESLLQYESVRLFTDRALTVNQMFEVTNFNAPFLAELCNRLDGIPLAIELAAARTKILTIENILEKINDRFRILVSTDRSSVPRQQTLKAMIDWSYDLLSAGEKLLFARLSVFSGGWTMEAAEEVCPDNEIDRYEILDLLANLCDKSLIVSNGSEGNHRYHMLESLRQYADNIITDKTEIQKKHYQYYFELSRKRSDQKGKEKIAAIKMMKTEHENLRSAISWSMENDTESALRLANVMDEFWELNGNISEGYEIFKKIFAKNIESSDELISSGYITAGFLASQVGEYDDSFSYLNKSLEISKKTDDKILIAECLNNLGNLQYIKNEMEEARRNHEEALKIGNVIKDKLTISTSIINLASIDAFFGDNENAISRYEEGLSLMRDLNDEQMTARILPQLAYSYTRSGNVEMARKLYEECLPVLKESEDLIPLSIALLHLGDISFSESKYEETEHLYDECISITGDHGYKYIYLYALINMGNLKLATGDILKSKEMYFECLKLCSHDSDRHKLAACFKGLAKYFYVINSYELSALTFGVSAALFESLGLKLIDNSSGKLNLSIADLKEALSEDKFNEHFEKGRSMKTEDAVKFFLMS